LTIARGTQHKLSLRPPDIERESTDNFAAVESHLNNNNTKSPPKIFYQWYNLHNAEMKIFLPIFVCLVKMFFINYEVSQSYPNARGVKGPNSRDVEVPFDGKGASVLNRRPMNKLKKW
jgi:hypothetical protein